MAFRFGFVASSSIHGSNTISERRGGTSNMSHSPPHSIVHTGMFPKQDISSRVEEWLSTCPKVDHCPQVFSANRWSEIRSHYTKPFASSSTDQANVEGTSSSIRSSTSQERRQLETGRSQFVMNAIDMEQASAQQNEHQGGGPSIPNFRIENPQSPLEPMNNQIFPNAAEYEEYYEDGFDMAILDPAIGFFGPLTPTSPNPDDYPPYPILNNQTDFFEWTVVPRIICLGGVLFSDPPSTPVVLPTLELQPELPYVPLITIPSPIRSSCLTPNPQRQKPTTAKKNKDIKITVRSVPIRPRQTGRSQFVLNAINMEQASAQQNEHQGGGPSIPDSRIKNPQSPLEPTNSQIFPNAAEYEEYYEDGFDMAILDPAIGFFGPLTPTSPNPDDYPPYPILNNETDYYEWTVVPRIICLGGVLFSDPPSTPVMLPTLKLEPELPYVPLITIPSPIRSSRLTPNPQRQKPTTAKKNKDVKITVRSVPIGPRRPVNSMLPNSERQSATSYGSTNASISYIEWIKLPKQQQKEVQNRLNRELAAKVLAREQKRKEQNMLGYQNQRT